MPIITVIAPVYKVERYLRRCIDSILVQTLTDFECILIDDGSPDNCPTICDEYAGNDERIRVIHQENRGTAFARDAGIKNAKGEFLVFVDSDDWLEPNALE
jgi:glycosyltransferase involved in cell wall biosynthesis